MWIRGSSPPVWFPSRPHGNSMPGNLRPQPKGVLTRPPMPPACPSRPSVFLRDTRATKRTFLRQVTKKCSTIWNPQTISEPRNTTIKQTSPSYEKQTAKIQNPHHPLTQRKTKWIETPTKIVNTSTQKKQTKNNASYMVTDNTHRVNEYTTHKQNKNEYLMRQRITDPDIKETNS